MAAKQIGLIIILFCMLLLAISEMPAWAGGKIQGETSASGTAPGSSSRGPIAVDRFSAGSESCWRGLAGAKNWWWQIRFAEPRMIGAILQIQGDQPSMFANAPLDYIWQASRDGLNWQDLPEAGTRRERRLFRVHRLTKACRTSYLRLKNRYVYAAQFHIEMAGTPENSRKIMGNFLDLARAWGGYNPRGMQVRMPESIVAGNR
jgi:hypothetical protein